MQQPPATCPAVFLTAPASGQGKTTITAGIARLLKRQQCKVKVFKCGPDYLDPQILEQASGQAVEPLDLWMAGDQYCQQRFFEAAQQNDLIIVEGAMGMFDGTPSSADLAARFNIPMVLVMDVKGMAQTAAAVASGLASFRQDITVTGLIANHCSTARHRELIEDNLPECLPLWANLPRAENIALPERHLGLVQANEIHQELEQRFEAAADALQLAGLLPLIQSLPATEFYAVDSYSEGCDNIDQALAGKTIAIAKDNAFSFIYQANVDLLRKMGAKVCYFSPLSDHQLPACDAIWLPGGYPELHARALSENTQMLQQIRESVQSGLPVLAECGGFLYCLETLTDLNDQQYPMAAALTGHGAMRGKRGCQGMQTAPLPEGDVRAHAHHRSLAHGTPEAISYGKRQRHSAPGEAVFRQNRLTASYLHLFFPSNPLAIAKLFGYREVPSI